MANSKQNNYGILAFCVVVLAAFALVLAIPSSREIFKLLSGTHPFVMGFIKFGLLATVGEILAIKLATKVWAPPIKMGPKILIWGLIGIWITYMMKVFPGGIAYILSAGIIPGEGSALLAAFLTSATMNLCFGPTFMAFHKCTDKWLELKHKGASDTSISAIVKGIDWTTFVNFTLFKTIPIFWIPAHTATFMLPSEYQVVVAATLSIALGIILSLKKN